METEEQNMFLCVSVWGQDDSNVKSICLAKHTEENKSDILDSALRVVMMKF